MNTCVCCGQTRKGENHGHQNHHRYARLRRARLVRADGGRQCRRRRDTEKRGKATTQEAHLAEIDKKLGKMQEHQDEQYLAILRLTIMSEEMPMAERLIAGEKYKRWAETAT